MRKVTRSLFHDEDDDDMVNCTLQWGECHYGASVLSQHVVCRLLQGAHSTSGADNEYNLRSRTVICDSCGQTSERGSGVNSSGDLPEGLVGHSFFIGANEPRQVVIKLKIILNSCLFM